MKNALKNEFEMKNKHKNNKIHHHVKEFNLK
jgi:hypothetical protein